jgi:hypothetical protein
MGRLITRERGRNIRKVIRLRYLNLAMGECERGLGDEVVILDGFGRMESWWYYTVMGGGRNRVEL